MRNVEYRMISFQATVWETRRDLVSRVMNTYGGECSHTSSAGELGDERYQNHEARDEYERILRFHKAHEKGVGLIRSIPK